MKNNSEFIPKEADKGDCVVLMNKPNYKKKFQLLNFLNYANAYQKPDQKCDNRVLKKIGELENKFESLLTKKEKLHLTNISFSTSNFYKLPKAHKSKQISETIQQQNKEYIQIHKPDDLTVRQTVSGPNFPTRTLCQLIDIIFKPF